MTTTTPTQATCAPLPWWRYGYVWMVVGGPLVVVVASVLTYFIAVYSADGLVSKEAVEQGAAQLKPGTSRTPGMLPALVGRNHAATINPDK